MPTWLRKKTFLNATLLNLKDEHRTIYLKFNCQTLKTSKACNEAIKSCEMLT